MVRIGTSDYITRRRHKTAQSCWRNSSLALLLCLTTERDATILALFQLFAHIYAYKISLSSIDLTDDSVMASKSDKNSSEDHIGEKHVRRSISVRLVRHSGMWTIIKNIQ